MATKQFYATGAFKYGTRMMRAGDPVEMDAPTARLYMALKKISPSKPNATATVPAPTEPAPQLAPKAPAKPKAARKRTTRRKK